MVWANLVLNCLLFYVLWNLGRWAGGQFQRGRYNRRDRIRAILLPLSLGVTLTLLDALRLGFLQQLLLFLVLAALLYWLFAIFLRK
jgi:hypothetical protein